MSSGAAVASFLNGLSVWVAPVVFMLGVYETLVAEFIKGPDVEREKARLGTRTTAACLMLIGIGIRVFVPELAAWFGN